MASSAKKVKKTPSNNRSDSGTDEPEAVLVSPSASGSGTSSSSSKLLCVICGGPSSGNITKDQNYAAMLQLYWCTLGVDIKPDACQKLDTCRKCFMNLVEYFETNDVIVYFENYFKSLRLTLLKNTLKGAAAWAEAGQTLTKPQLEAKQKYSEQLDITKPEEEAIKQTLDGYRFESYDIIDSDDEDNGSNKKSASRTGIKLTRLGINGDENGEKETSKKPSSSSSKSSQKAKKTGGGDSDSD